MGARKEPIQTIVIIGGGASGVLTAYHLTRQSVRARVIVIEPRAKLGLGLAYSTPSLRHLLNVPAGKISALPDQPDHFLNWLKQHYDSAATPMTFAPRTVFGRYLQQLFTSASDVEHERSSVVDYQPLESGAVLTLDDGRHVRADKVVLATGNFDPAELPGVSDETKQTGAYCHNAWLNSAYGKLDPGAPVTLIGTGLTAVDVLLRLRELGHRGVITAVSRNGFFPHRHVPYTPLGDSAIPSGTPATCRAYFHSVRTAIRKGDDWRAVIDSLREATNALWLALPLEEQRRFHRHLQRRWEIVRHRMAPPIADVIDAELKSGSLVIRKGHVASIEPNEDGATLTLRTQSGMESFDTTRVINCTGPDMNYRRVNSPLLRSLFAQRLISAGPAGKGLHCNRKGAVLDAQGKPSGVLFNLGPGRLGTLLESIAIPEIRQQAVELAAVLTASIGKSDIRDPECVANNCGLPSPTHPLPKVAA